MQFQQSVIRRLFNIYLLFGNWLAMHIAGDSIEEIPLLDNGDVPLFAKLDTTKMNAAIKTFIQKTIDRKLSELEVKMKRKLLDEIKHEKYPRDCEDLGKVSSGVYRIYPLDIRGFDVYCDMETDGGGWTVFQRRLDGTVDFFRGWNDYEYGFGDTSKEFWLGNSKIHDLTSRDQYELYILMEDFEGTKKYARYQTFSVGGPASGYLLNVGSYTGNAGDSLSYHNNRKFSTKDKDATTKRCATEYKGAWWYNACHVSNLNGLYLNGTHTSHADGINWETWRGYRYSLQKSTMMVRRMQRL